MEAKVEIQTASLNKILTVLLVIELGILVYFAHSYANDKVLSSLCTSSYFKDEILATPQVENCNQQPSMELKDLVASSQIPDSARFDKQVIGLSFRVDKNNEIHLILQSNNFVLSLIKVI